MRILEVITDTNVGGAGILLETRCKYMDRSKYQITVAMPKGSLLYDRFRKIGVQILEVDGCYDCSLDIHSIPMWIAILKKIRPLIVNCHGCLSCRIAARLCGAPVLVDTRHCAFPPKRWMTIFPGKPLIGWFLNHLSDYTIAVAEAAKENLVSIGVTPKKITVIINGSRSISPISEEKKRQLRDHLGISKDCLVISMFARLEACKDHDTLLNAASLLLKNNPKFVFLIVGDGSRMHYLKNKSIRLGISESVIFTGFAQDVTPYMNITDIQVNCSIGTETSSLALSEGMSLGIPAIVSNFGGNPYMVQNGINGLIFPIKRYDLLAQWIQKIADDPMLYIHLSNGAKKRYETELNAERMTRDTEALYDACYQEKCNQRRKHKDSIERL